MKYLFTYNEFEEIEKIFNLEDSRRNIEYLNTLFNLIIKLSQNKDTKLNYVNKKNIIKVYGDDFVIKKENNFYKYYDNEGVLFFQDFENSVIILRNKIASDFISISYSEKLMDYLYRIIEKLLKINSEEILKQDNIKLKFKL